MFLCVVVCPASPVANLGHPKASRLLAQRPDQRLRPLSLNPTRALLSQRKFPKQAKPVLQRPLRPLRLPSALLRLLQLVGKSRPVHSVILHFVVVSLAWPAGTRGHPKASPQPRPGSQQPQSMQLHLPPQTPPPCRRRRLLPRTRLSLTPRPRPALMLRQLLRRQRSRTSLHRTRARLPPHLLRNRRGPDSGSRQGLRRRSRQQNRPPSRLTNRLPSLRPSLQPNRLRSLQRRRALRQPRRPRHLLRLQPRALRRRRRSR